MASPGDGGGSRDYDDPEVDARWCDEERARVIAYLRREGLAHGGVGEWPAWHVAPIIAVWAVESAARPGWIGWWAFSGDLPTDYISSAEVAPPQHPRKALRVIATRWHEMAEAWMAGKEYPGVGMPGALPHLELAPMLLARAETILGWVNDDGVWENEDPK